MLRILSSLTKGSILGGMSSLIVTNGLSIPIVAAGGLLGAGYGTTEVLYENYKKHKWFLVTEKSLEELMQDWNQEKFASVVEQFLKNGNTRNYKKLGNQFVHQLWEKDIRVGMLHLGGAADEILLSPYRKQSQIAAVSGSLNEIDRWYSCWYFTSKKGPLDELRKELRKENKKYCNRLVNVGRNLSEITCYQFDTSYHLKALVDIPIAKIPKQREYYQKIERNLTKMNDYLSLILEVKGLEELDELEQRGCYVFSYFMSKTDQVTKLIADYQGQVLLAKRNPVEFKRQGLEEFSGIKKAIIEEEINNYLRS